MTHIPQVTVDQVLDDMRAAEAQLTAERVNLAERRAAYAAQAEQVPAPLEAMTAEANADAQSSMALIPLIGIALCLGFGALGIVVFGLSWLSTHGTLAGLEALGSLGLIVLGWAGADRLARRGARGR